MAQLHLPMNHFSVGTTILKGATQLACAPHDFQPSVPPSHMIHLLNQLIDVVERALEYSEASNENLVLLFYTLYYHLIAIYTRFAILGDTSDLERCLYLSDVLRHFCDPKDLFLLCRAVSLTLVGLRLWCQPSRVSPRRDAWLNDQSVSGLDISRNFLDFAESVISKANLSLDRPVEDAGLLGHRGEMIGDLNQVINYLDEALDSCNIRQQDLQLLADTLFIKGKALKVLYAFVDNVDNLDYSIHLFEIVPHISRPSIACDYYSLAMELCYSLHLRYQAKRYPADCDRIAEVGEELLSHGWWLSDTDRLNVCLLLFRNLRNCFEIGRAVEECEHSFQIYHQALPPSVALADEHRSVWRQIQIEVLLCRSMGGHKIQDLQEALNFFKEAANNPPDEVTSPLVVLFLASQFKVAIVSGDMEMVARLESVHTQRYFATWFNHSPFRTDTKIVLDHIIETLKQRFKESASVQLSAALLVSSLQERYHRFKRPRDLREALAFRSNPSFGPLGTYCNDIVLLRAATDDLDPVAMEQRLVNATELHWAEGHVCPSFARFTPKGRGTFPDFLRTHALPLKRMSDTSGSLSPTWRYIYNPSAADSDFQVAREKHLLALSESVDNPLQYRNTLTSLATLHFERMARYETIQDLEQGVDVLERYLDTLSDDDDSEFAWKERSRWARRFLELNLLGRDTPLAHGHPKLLLAHEYLRKIVVDEHNLQHYQRLITIADWFRFVPAVWQGSQIHVQSMADLALELLEQQCWSASNIRASVETRHKMRYLLGNMVVFMLFAGHKSRAIEILEEGQSLLWNQISSLRTPLDDLISVSPVLASRLRELSRTLERQLGFSSETESDSLGLSNWQVAEARDAILEDIRMLPSFESFLKPRTFEELKSVGADGPVVLLLSHASLCAAFIFLGEHYMELQLPISYTTVGELRSTLRASARTRGGEDEEPEEERDGDENVFYMKQATDADEDYRSLRRRRNAETGMEHVLEVLWKQVAEPVLKKIMSNIPGDKGKRKEYERPVS